MGVKYVGPPVAKDDYSKRTSMTVNGPENGYTFKHQAWMRKGCGYSLVQRF